MTNPNEILEDALAKRLAKLAATPIDTTHLDQALRAHLPPPPAVVSARSRPWLKPLVALAASLLLIATVTLALLSPSAAQASPQEIASLHTQVITGSNMMPTRSVGEVNQMIAAMGHSLTIPGLPANPPECCCMRKLKDKDVVCLLLKEGNTAVTMTVAAACDMKCPSSAPTVTRGPNTYHVSQVGSLNMVMTARHNRWVCLVSQAPQETLLTLAEKLQF